MKVLSMKRENVLRRERMNARKALGLCPKCGEPSASGRQLCLYHSELNARSCRLWDAKNRPTKGLRTRPQRYDLEDQTFENEEAIQQFASTSSVLDKSHGLDFQRRTALQDFLDRRRSDSRFNPNFEQESQA